MYKCLSLERGLNTFLLFERRPLRVCEFYQAHLKDWRKKPFLLSNIFERFLWFFFFFSTEPVATEHQSHLLVLEVVRHWIQVDKIVTYRKYIILIFHIAVQIFCELSETTCVLIESCLNQCTLVTTVIIIPLFLFWACRLSWCSIRFIQSYISRPPSVLNFWSYDAFGVMLD